MRLCIQNIPRRIRTIPHLPSSKSISNRLLMISALSGNKVHPVNLSESDDTQTMIRLLRSRDKIKDAGHAGTTMRFLTAYYAIGNQEVILTGTERMKNRPIGKLVGALQELGASITYMEKEGYPPLHIIGKKLSGKPIRIDSGISSQFISALLMTGPCLNGG
ncbi:MAG: 3-phosphoshikimate 1-carboxyvinyltransferase, partial [Bacteroidota bacterium]